MTHQMTSTALYILLLPILAVVATIALGVLSLLFRSRWSAPAEEASPRSAARAAPRAAADPAAAPGPALAQDPQRREPAPDRLREPEPA